MEIKEFNNQNISGMRKELQTLLNNFAAEKGITIGLGTIRYDSSSFRVKMEVKTKHQPEGRLTLTKLPFQIAVGDVFRNKRTDYTVKEIGCSGMYSIKVETQNGKPYNIKPETLAGWELIK
jgi:hypothetical protein